MGELLPCPFCGGPASVDTTEHARPKGRHLFIVQVWCDDCDTGMSRNEYNDQPSAHAQAIAAWNRRVPVAELTVSLAPKTQSGTDD